MKEMFLRIQQAGLCGNRKMTVSHVQSYGIHMQSQTLQRVQIFC